VYQMNQWVDRVRDANGNIIVQGTPWTKTRGDNIEKGIFESFASINVLTQEMMQRKRELGNAIFEIGTITLTNNQLYPFNNSRLTVNLRTPRNTLNYTVLVEHNAINEGKVIVTDKQLNGFKLEYTGSAVSVTVKYYVRGGMMQQ